MSKNSNRRKKQEAERSAIKLLHKLANLQKQEPDSLSRSNQTDQKQIRFLWLKRLRAHLGVKIMYFSWKLIGGVVALVVLLSSLISVVFLFPKIDVQPGNSLNPQNPFSTLFILENQSFAPIFDVTWEDVWKNGYAKSPTINMIDVQTGTFQKIAAYGKESMRIGTLMPGLHIPSISIAVSVKYKPKFWYSTKEETFFFWARTNTDGVWQWQNAGKNNGGLLHNLTNLITIYGSATFVMGNKLGYLA